MQATRLGDRLTVSGQVTRPDMDRLAEGGVSMLVNTRPDNEEQGQPTAAASRAIAETAGLAYVHIPVGVATIAPGDIDAFGTAFRSTTGKVHAHCKSGLRAAMLWGLDRIRNEHADPDEVTREVHAAGFDPTAMLHTLQRLSRET